ncbi:MAG: hypothetical protein COS57_17120 [Syntrophobacterales bacterium CG03_land_8_20_14_0_80_58_14]|nr:MAG: hypothetical protein AUK26_07845 [Syntrophaceae bacterium CG2_30_58_14]PIU99986.1 MAG: hypothetical protein COS57_17120 [Syntrophobacterales bacterium CG03_land_8_20_14_0_80_58_14]
MVVCTIGFAKKNLKAFISKLRAADVKKVVDIRLHNTLQLAGYAKKDDLEYVLDLVGIGYEHHPELAPTEEILDGYKKKGISWAEYERLFRALLAERDPLKNSPLARQPGPICILCAEDKPTQCHRRLVAEHFTERVHGVEIRHL